MDVAGHVMFTNSLNIIESVKDRILMVVSINGIHSKSSCYLGNFRFLFQSHRGDLSSQSVSLARIVVVGSVHLLLLVLLPW